MKFAFRSSPLALALCASLTLSVAACGSSNPESSASGLKGEPVRITIISDATAFPEVQEAARARASYINANGGIAGRPLKLVECTTKGDPNVTQACARTAVSNGSVAVVGLTTLGDFLATPILAQAKIANIGLTPSSPVAGDSEHAFCFNPGIAGDLRAGAKSLVAAGATKVNLIYADDSGPLSALMKDSFLGGAEHANVESGTPAGFSSRATQYDAPVAKAAQDGVDGIFGISYGGAQVTLIQSIRRQHPNVAIGSISLTMTPTVLSALGKSGDGVAVTALTQPATATSLPGIKQFNADMDAYAKSSPRTDLAINAWASVWAFAQVATELPTITRASVLTAMSQLKDLDLGGIYPPLSANSMSSKMPGLACAMNAQVVLSKVSEGRLVAVNPGEFYNPFGS